MSHIVIAHSGMIRCHRRAFHIKLIKWILRPLINSRIRIRNRQQQLNQMRQHSPNTAYAFRLIENAQTAEWCGFSSVCDKPQISHRTSFGFAAIFFPCKNGAKWWKVTPLDQFEIQICIWNRREKEREREQKGTKENQIFTWFVAPRIQNSNPFNRMHPTSTTTTRSLCNRNRTVNWWTHWVRALRLRFVIQTRVCALYRNLSCFCGYFGNKYKNQCFLWEIGFGTLPIASACITFSSRAYRKIDFISLQNKMHA